jgi:diaminopimelate epimerase
MPGGRITINIDHNYGITMTGPVTRVADGTMAAEMLEDMQ